MTQILLADEINRATPRAQAALLECMAERQVSVEMKTYRLRRPFFVIATQNPIEHEGTFALPEAQLDRFLMRLSLGYPDHEAEEKMLTAGQTSEPFDAVQQVMSLDVLTRLQDAVRTVHVHPQVRQYVVQVVAATRASKDLALGAGPRATQGLYRVCQAYAALRGRDFVLPDDVKRLYPAILYHRVILGAEGRLSRKTTRQVELTVTAAASIVEFVLAGDQRAGLLANGGDAAERYGDWTGGSFRRLDEAREEAAVHRRTSVFRPLEVAPAKGGRQLARLRTALARLTPARGLPRRRGRGGGRAAGGRRRPGPGSVGGRADPGGGVDPRRPRHPRALAVDPGGDRRGRGPRAELDLGGLDELDARAAVVAGYTRLLAAFGGLGYERPERQTPYEYLEELPAHLRHLRPQVAGLTELYVRAAYGAGELGEAERRDVFTALAEIKRGLPSAATSG